MSVHKNTKSNTYPETGGVNEEPTWGERQRTYSRRPLSRSADRSNNEERGVSRGHSSSSRTERRAKPNHV